MTLQGKTAVMTGCLQGIGRSALICSRNGANVVACVQVKTDEFLEHADQLGKQFGVRIVPVAFDMASNDSSKAPSGKFRRKNCPSTFWSTSRDREGFHFPDGDARSDAGSLPDQFLLPDRPYPIHFKAHAAPGPWEHHLHLQLTALDGNFGQLTYSASKAALIAAMKTMAIELGPKGIRVNAIAPGSSKRR
jgi:3-oxoacyl-[acyl-carrier protein] reductase